MKISIIIPCFNEEKTLSQIVEKVVLFNSYDKEIIIVVDCSSDNTPSIINDLVTKYDEIKSIRHERNFGKGEGIKSGVKISTGNIILIQDADLEYNPKDIIKIYNFIKKNQIDVVYGSRVLNKNKYQNTKNFTHLVRIWGNVFLTLVSNLINNQNLTDAHTCYKMIRARLFKKLNLREKGFAFCPEVTTKLSKMNCKIYEVSISYNGRTYNDGKKITSIDGLIALISLIKYRLLD